MKSHPVPEGDQAPGEKKKGKKEEKQERRIYLTSGHSLLKEFRER